MDANPSIDKQPGGCKGGRFSSRCHQGSSTDAPTKLKKQGLGNPHCGGGDVLPPDHWIAHQGTKNWGEFDGQNDSGKSGILTGGQTYGGFLSHGGTPSHHPFLDGIFPDNPSILGYPHFRKPPYLQNQWFLVSRVTPCPKICDAGGHGLSG